MEPALISGFCSVKRMRVKVSSQQTLVLIYLPRKDGKLSWLRRERRLHKYSNLGKAGDRTGNLVVGRQRSYQLRQPCPPTELCAKHCFQQKLKLKRTANPELQSNKEWGN